MFKNKKECFESAVPLRAQSLNFQEATSEHYNSRSDDNCNYDCNDDSGNNSVLYFITILLPESSFSSIATSIAIKSSKSVNDFLFIFFNDIKYYTKNVK